MAASVVESNSAERPSDPVDTSSSEEESGPSTIIHESLLNARVKFDQRTSVRKEKYTPPDESEEQRNLRTIFVGNISSDVAQKRVSHRILTNQQWHDTEYVTAFAETAP